jgi:hypothetical protein
MLTFLTAYDPSDLPGGSIDPLGFERGYLHLAEKILPGMTNVASCPRYLSLLCAGSALAGELDDLPDVRAARARRDAVMRLERLWALANVLAHGTEGENALAGLRGVRYARRYVEHLEALGATATDGDYRLLSRQAPYGVLGMYSVVADAAKLVWRKTLEVRPDSGQPLGEAFVRETAMPRSVQRATAGETVEVRLAELKAWGERAFLWAEPGADERRGLKEALEANPTRIALVEMLRELPPREGESELERLGRVAARLKGEKPLDHLWESAEAVLRYEACYRAAKLALDRLLSLCCAVQGGALEVGATADDPVLTTARRALAVTVPELVAHLDTAETEHFRQGLETLADVRLFLERAAGAADNEQLLQAVLERHTDVQHGKFDRGRRKMPWVKRDGGQWMLTMSRQDSRDGSAATPEEITPHPYRLTAADNWAKAAGL